MKVSKYITRVDLPNGGLLVHSGLKGVTLHVARSQKGEFDMLLQGKIPQTQDPLIDSAYQDVISTFKKAMILLDDGIDELKLLESLYHKAQYEDELRLIISPTMECNLSCRYCHKSDGNHTMDKGIIDDTVGFIQDYIAGIANKTCTIHIIWSGGEPLYNFNIFCELAEKIYEVANQYDCDVSSELLTNGTLMNKKIVSKICRHPFDIEMVQVSLNGPKSIHDQTQYFQNAKPTFDIICNNIKIAKKYLKVKVKINAYRNFDVNRFKILINELYERNVISHGEHNPTFFLGRAYEDCRDVGRFSDIFTTKKFASIELECARIAKEMKFPLQLGNFEKPAYMGCNQLNVHAFTIDSEGLLGKCQNLIGCRENTYGKVTQMLDTLDVQYRKWIDYKPFHYEKCRNCHVLPLCGGGCALLAMNRKTSDQACIPEKFNLKERLLLEYSEA